MRARSLVNCAGLHADRVARMCGVDPGIRIIPFRGVYLQLRPECRRWVRGLIYPVPDPALPFLGMHLTRTIDDRVEAGPSALLALSRGAHDSRPQRCARLWDFADTLSFPGFWRMAGRHWRSGLVEWRRAVSERQFLRALQRLLPTVRADDLVGRRSGVRAQAVDRVGRLLDDFYILKTNDSVHVLNAPSPAATASIEIGRRVAERLLHLTR